MKILKINKAFTLVELIVVVTILAILSTIGFVSYSGYLTGVRDTNRISSLTAISDGLELYRTRNDLPLPDDSVEVKVEGTTIARQGYVGKNVLQTIEYSKAGKDPKDDSYYSYYLTDDNKYYQLMAFLEESDQLEVKTLSQTQAATNYSNRHPKVYGKRLGILTDTDNTPIQELSSIATAGELDITSSLSDSYISRYSDDDILTASGSALSMVATNGSCKRIKELNGKSQDGVYTLNQGGTSFEVYCDMTTDGGGWTYVTILADTTTRNLFDTGNTNKITSLTQNISTKGQIQDIWIDNENKDLLLQCFTEYEDLKSYEIPFIIYDYLKVDIGDLIKQTKQNTKFSTTNLKAKWKSNNYTMSAVYGDSSANTSMYLLADDNTFLYTFGESDDLRVVNYNPFNPSPTYPINGSLVIQPFSSSNYCMTAIR